MADEPDNMILRLLRETRSGMGGVKHILERHDARLEGIDRRLGDLTESAALAMGMAAHSPVAQESLGQRLDTMWVELDRVKERLDRLDERP